MTYREAIQIQINTLMHVYDNIGNIRDAATHDEEQFLNNVRRELPGIWQHLQKIDNSITDKRGAAPLKGNYEVHCT